KEPNERLKAALSEPLFLFRLFSVFSVYSVVALLPETVMQFHREVLPNGLTIVGETNPSARSVALAYWVRTGARDETPEVSGVTHFLEHMIFKGTERRDAFAVNRDLDRIGASPNAFTPEENTVF